MRVERTEAFREWIDGLTDVRGRARILTRIDRLIHSNPGLYRRLSDGVSELKIDVGPGYRVYFHQQGDVLLILLGGGDKSSQRNDIERAIRILRSLEARNR